MPGLGKTEGMQIRLARETLKNEYFIREKLGIGKIILTVLEVSKDIAG
jgi:hypothetical protein